MLRILAQRRTIVTGALLALAIWLPRGLALDRFVTADEHAWLTRSGNFYYALAHGDLAGTFQREHPGVTVTWAGLVGFLIDYPGYAHEAPGQFGWLTEQIEPFLRAHGHDPIAILATGRAVSVAVITVTLLVAFALAIRLFGLGPALFGFMLIALDPFHLAHSRLLHLDGLVSSFMFLAVIAFIRYLDDRRVWLLVTSAIVAGLACLTRSPAFFLGPLAGLLALIAYFRRRPNSQTQVAQAQTTGRFWQLARATIAWGLMVAAVFVVLWPAMWVHPLDSLARVLNAAETYAAEGHLKPIFFNGGIYGGDPGFNFYPITYLWRTTPVVWIGLMLGGIAYFLRWTPFANERARFAGGMLILYALLFALFMNIGAKKFDRYILPSYLPLDLIAGVGWTAALTQLYGRLRAGVWRVAAPLLAVAALGMQAALVLPTFPYYLSYYNPLLGGSAKAPQVMMIGWGEGADAAARYLDSKPDAQHLVVASGYTNGPFSYFFNGQTVPIYFWPQAAYAVVYAQDWQRQLPSRKSIAYFRSLTPEHIVQINGLDYAHIYDLRGASLPAYVTDWGGAIRLITYQLPASTIAPGDSFGAIFYFENLAPIATNLNVAVRVVGIDGQELIHSDGWPWGSPTSTWPLHDIWPDGHTLIAPKTAPPGYYKVQVGFYDPANGKLLPATRAATGEALGDLVTLDYIQIGDVPARPELPLHPPANLGDQLQLLGASWRDGTGAAFQPQTQTLRPGQVVTVRLFWQATQEMNIDYTTFLHVVGPDGKLAAQTDQQPTGSFLPTSAWYRGQIVAADYVLTVPATAPGGEYTVDAGMYDLATGQRLPITRGGKAAGDTLDLATLRIRATP